MTTPAEAVAKLRELLEYRLPHSGKPLGTVVLSREMGEALLALLDKRLDEMPSGEH
jgi:hypothetical protein